MLTEAELLDRDEGLALEGLDHLVVRDLCAHPEDLLQEPAVLGRHRVRPGGHHLARRDELLRELVVVVPAELLGEGRQAAGLVRVPGGVPAGGAALLVVRVLDEVLQSRLELGAELGRGELGVVERVEDLLELLVLVPERLGVGLGQAGRVVDGDLPARAEVGGS